MKNLNPFENKNHRNKSSLGFTKKLIEICEPMQLGESLLIEIEGITNQTIKSLLSRHFKSEFTTLKSEGNTWIKRISPNQ